MTNTENNATAGSFRALHEGALLGFGVKVLPADPDKAVAAALMAAYSATPSDYAIEGRGLGVARKVAGQSAANLSLAIARNA